MARKQESQRLSIMPILDRALTLNRIMNQTEKLLLFRSLGMILWVFKQIILSSRIEEKTKAKILTRLNGLIKDVTNYVNQLLVNQEDF